MAEGFRFMPLGLVRLRIFRLSAWVTLGATLTQVFTRVGGTDVSLRDVTIAQRETGLPSAGDVTPRKRSEDLGDFEKVS